MPVQVPLEDAFVNSVQTTNDNSKVQVKWQRSLNDKIFWQGCYNYNASSSPIEDAFVNPVNDNDNCIHGKREKKWQNNGTVNKIFQQNCNN